jgi:hypothetical protein
VWGLHLLVDPTAGLGFGDLGVHNQNNVLTGVIGVKKFLMGAVAATAATASFLMPAQAADLDAGCIQAVSGFNGKVEGAGGFGEVQPEAAAPGGPAPAKIDEGRFHGAATLSLPLGCMLGLQLDGAAGEAFGEEFAGFGGHLFMRDPNSYLAGVYATYTDHGPNEIWRVGPEVELYLGNFSIEGWAGFENSDSNGDDFFAHVDLAMYATDNLRLNVGFRRFLDINLFSAGGEWQPEWDGLPVSFFVEGQFGEQDYASVLGGIRFYFGGPDKSLIRRHREDDPSNKTMTMLGVSCSNATPSTQDRVIRVDQSMAQKAIVILPQAPAVNSGCVGSPNMDYRPMPDQVRDR